MTNQRICILGGTGFVGHHLVTRLAASGYRCRLLARRPERHRDLSLVPGTELRRSDIFETGVLEKQLEGCTAVINLVGILNEGSGRTFQRVHVDLVERILAAAQAVEVPRYLHMSALHAQSTRGTSRYLRTKGKGEDLAHAGTHMQVTSFRPSVIFGPGDGFFNRFATLLKITPGVFPLACPDARFAPVYVGDVVSAMAKALANPGCVGKGYDLCGPRIYSLKELVKYTAGLIGRKTMVIGLPDFGARLQARVFQLLPGKPFTMDNYLSLQTDSICEHDGLAELGIEPRTVEALVPGYLH
ncbi:complex I NDUFA9 subunit family protein [Candidatus Thiosymbion oneisti]|uniref:complex I NDUFA9 subunit family protein n=1 Tax=Candidatus Thiosymbion oneisti TaxID=589554 RepID=UPI000A5988B2|nr:complex I NDUFA9 subunit family protein [Candidatus Thiosymbion oneisti]